MTEGLSAIYLNLYYNFNVDKPANVLNLFELGQNDIDSGLGIPTRERPKQKASLEGLHFITLEIALKAVLSGLCIMSTGLGREQSHSSYGVAYSNVS